MKRQSVTALFATLILCFWSNSTLADIYYLDLDGGDIIGLVVYINNETVYDEEASISHGPIYPVPSHDEVFDELSYNDGTVSAYVSTSYGFSREENGFTINLSINGSGTQLENVMYYFPRLYCEYGPAWQIYNLQPNEKVLMKVEIIGSNPDYLNGWYYNLWQPLNFNYDGTYYTTYLTEGNYRMCPGMDSWDSPYPINTDISRNCQINCTFEVVPVPGAVLLGLIGLGYSGLRLRRKTI